MEIDVVTNAVFTILSSDFSRICPGGFGQMEGRDQNFKKGKKNCYPTPPPDKCWEILK
jgi:hypothetical protein